MTLSGEARRSHWLLPRDRDALIRQGLKFPQHGQSHARAGAAEIEQTVTCAASGHEAPVLRTQLMQKHVGVDEVKAVPVWQICGHGVSIKSGERTLLAIEPRNIGDEP